MPAKWPIGGGSKARVGVITASTSQRARTASASPRRVRWCPAAASSVTAVPRSRTQRTMGEKSSSGSRDAKYAMTSVNVWKMSGPSGAYGEGTSTTSCPASARRSAAASADSRQCFATPTSAWNGRTVTPTRSRRAGAGASVACGEPGFPGLPAPPDAPGMPDGEGRSARRAASSSERVRKPGVASRPPRMSWAGLRPTSPHAAAGTRIEPPPSEPSAAATAPDATATAEPPDEPPGVRPGRSGLSGAGRPVGSV